jgi:hypothetical protein
MLTAEVLKGCAGKRTRLVSLRLQNTFL